MKTEAKVHIAGAPGESKQHCTRCHASLHGKQHFEEQSFWHTGALVVSHGHGSMGVVSPAEALHSRPCGRAPKIYKRPICVVVDFVYPPIPIRTFDWCAYEDGMEERGDYGHGRSRAEAVAALFELLDEDAE